MKRRKGKVMMIKRKIVLLAAVMFIAGMIPACGKDTNSADDGAGRADVPGAAADSDSAGASDAGEGARQDNYPDDAYIKSIKAADYVTLGEYKGIELTEEAVSVSKEDVKRYIDAYILAPRAVVTPVDDRTDVREGDTVNIDYTGYRDGEAFDGGSAQGYNLIIGSGQFIPGFEDGLIGKNVGEDVTLDLTFPENYDNAEMAGVSVTFEVTVNSISISELPELTDELVKELNIGENSTVAELNDYLYDSFNASAMNSYNQTLKLDITNAVMENSVFKDELPEHIVERYYDILIDDMTVTAASYGMDLNTYVKNYYNMDEEAYTEIIRDNAVTMVKQYIMFQAIADEEDLNMTQEEQSAAMEKWAQDYGYASVEELQEDIGTETFNEYIMAEEVVAFLIDNAIINTNES